MERKPQANTGRTHTRGSCWRVINFSAWSLEAESRRNSEAHSVILRATRVMILGDSTHISLQMSEILDNALWVFDSRVGAQLLTISLYTEHAIKGNQEIWLNKWKFSWDQTWLKNLKRVILEYLERQLLVWMVFIHLQWGISKRKIVFNRHQCNHIW